MLTTKPGKAYSVLKKLGARPGDTEDASSFTLPNHTEANLSPQQSADSIAKYFASVSQEYEPLNIDSLPAHVQRLLSQPVDLSQIPQLSDYQVWEKMKQARVAQSQVNGDILGKLAKEFSPELALPTSIIFNQILK